MIPQQRAQFVEPSFREPTLNNPFANVPIAAYDNTQKYDDYYRLPAVPTAKSEYIRNLTEKDFKGRNFVDPASQNLMNRLFQTPEDALYQHGSSQRQFYSMPVGSVPSNQSAFAESLYGREFVCKSGSIYMRYDIPYTDDSLACTGFEGDGQVTNFGQLK